MARVPSAAAKLVGSRIRSRREELEMTQDDLANASGMDPSNIRAFERGGGMPNVYTVVRLSKALLFDEPGELLKGLRLDLFDSDSRE